MALHGLLGLTLKAFAGSYRALHGVYVILEDPTSALVKDVRMQEVRIHYIGTSTCGEHEGQGKTL